MRGVSEQTVQGRSRVHVVACAVTGLLVAGSGILLGAPELAAQDGGRGSVSAASSASSAPRRNADGRFLYDVGRSAANIDVDGAMDEAAWHDASVIALPYETQPGDNSPAPVATECRVTFDEENLYLGCRAYDSDPSAIRAYITDRDDIGGHDQVIFTIDPFNDARRAFQFGVSALGVQYDGVFAPGAEAQGGQGNNGGPDASWDAIWSSAGAINAEGYVVEAAIPFKSLRFPSSDGVQTWGFYATRYWPRSDDVQMRSMLWDRDNSCELCQGNLLTGFEAIAPSTNLQLAPTMTSARVDRRVDFPTGNIMNGDVEPEFGLDAQWGITSDLSLNATVNPDFSQVEADVAQVDVNNRFSLFFPERRPFFLEGADFFNTPIQALFTRSIADPTFGTKLSGKVGNRALGLLVAQDQVNNVLIPGDQFSRAASLDENVVTMTGRVRQDVGSSSNIGGLYVGREGENGYFNRVFGVDAFMRLLPAVTAQAQFLRSETRYSDGFAEAYDQRTGSFGGNAARVRLAYETRGWLAVVNTEHRTPGVRLDAGFVPQVDWRMINVWGQRRLYPSVDWMTRFVIAGGAWRQENTHGRLTDQGLWMNLEYQGPMQSRIWINPSVGGEHLAGVDYNGLSRLWFGGGIQPTGSIGLEFMGNVRQAVDVANQREGRVFQLNPSLNLRIGRKIDLRLTQSWFDMNTPDGEDVFTAKISQLRAVYNFSPRAFFRAVVQYRDTDRVPELNVAEVDPSSTSVLAQFLFSYKLNPQTVVFLGYNDDRAGFTDPQFNDVPITQAGRSFFLKLGYAWRP